MTAQEIKQNDPGAGVVTPASAFSPALAARRRAQVRADRRALVYPFASGIIGLLIWEAVVRILKMPPYLLPAPSHVMVVTWEYFPILIKQLGITAFAAGVGFAIALVGGVTCGAAITASRFIDRTLYPWLVIWHAIPKAVVAPLFIVWIGFGMTSEIIFVIVFTVFPIVVNTVTGLKSADPDLLLLVRSMGAERFQTLWKIRIPNALPSIFAGIKISATLAPVGAVIGEFVAANQGLGHLLIQAIGGLETPLAFAAVFVMAVFGIAIWYLTEAIERWTIPWHASQREPVLGL